MCKANGQNVAQGQDTTLGSVPISVNLAFQIENGHSWNLF